MLQYQHHYRYSNINYWYLPIIIVKIIFIFIFLIITHYVLSFLRNNIFSMKKIVFIIIIYTINLYYIIKKEQLFVGGG